MLVPADQGLPIAGLKIPEDFYWVLRAPAPLAGMKFPLGAWPWRAIHEAGFLDLVSLHPGDYSPAPLTLIFAGHLEDLAGGGLPSDPEREADLIRSAVMAALQSLRSGRGVVVHCWGGRGRTGTVLGCLLRELGYAAEVVVEYLAGIHVARGTNGWPESPWQADFVRRYQPMSERIPP